MSNRRHLANAVRALAMDSVQKANSGHPGAPMGMADIAEVLWNDYMKHNPTNPQWADRDRFILSNGHGSMLIYSLLHLTGYDLGIEDLKQFRQLHSRTPGHPEYGYAPGVETTTGPLGQGITNGVGMALAEKTLAAQFNKEGHNIVDHNTYVFLGDGCLMEGISHEACSLAGTLGLGKLVAFWDDNGISIDGEVEGWFTDDTPGRFEAYGWQVIRNVDGHSADEIKAAIETAKAETGKPTMVCCKTIIGFGSPNKAGSHDCHGAALGDEEIALVRKELDWKSAPFEIPADVYAGWDNKEAGAAAESDWDTRFEAYAAAYPTEAAELKRRLNNELSADWDAGVDAFIAEVDAQGATIASRKASQNAITALAKLTPEFLGGSADLAGSNLTLWPEAKPVCEHDDGNYVNYGVREFAMAAMINGISLHGGFVPYGATFLMFSEYARNALRMAALMKIRHIEVFTHDSIGLGEDGPTHQPVEQTATLRMIPNMDVWRPCDAVESAVSWKSAVKNMTGPTSLVFSRQGLPHQVRTADQIKLIEKGAYILKDCEGTPDAIIIGTGSEVSLAMEAAAAITDKKIRVVSMPSTNTFDKQDAAYKESVLPASVTARVAVEAGVTGFWAKYIGLNGKAVGIDTFGESAPIKDLYKLFGITTEAVVAAVNEVSK